MDKRGLAVRSVESEIKRTFFARLFEDEDLLEATASLAKRHGINSGFFFLIGTLKKAVLGYYKEGKYTPIEKAGSLEIASCMGNISVKEDSELVIHAHIVVSDGKGDAFAGHVLPGCLVDATAELVLVAVEDGILRREYEARKNLYLWSLAE